MANPFPFVSGAVLTAAQLNGIGEAWTSYTPTVTQSATITKTIAYAKYARVNKLVIVQVMMTATSAGTAGNAIAVGLPIASLNANGFGVIGTGMVYDLSASTSYLGMPVIDAGVVKFWNNASAGNYLGASPSFAIASGDFISFTVAIEVA
jgi:hypothetical protein